MEKSRSQAPAAGEPITPLTHRNADGDVYQREPAVEQQIAEALSLGLDQLRARAAIGNASASGYLQEECLVYLIRYHHAAGNRELENTAAELLLQRCASWIGGRLGQKLDPQRAQAGFSEIVAELFEQIIDLTSDRGDFLQVRFWVVLKRLTTRAFGKQVTQLRKEQQSVRWETLRGYDGDDDAGEEQGERAKSGLPISTPSIEPMVVDNQLIRDALNHIENPDHRCAFLLRYYAGWPIEDQDPTVRTISRHFQKDARTIRYWLAEAKESLSKWRGEQS